MDTCYSCGRPLRTVKDKPYHYDECGLRVVLLGVPQHVCDQCGESYVSIPNMQKLHRVIGRIVCSRRKALLLPEEIKFLRKDLQLRAKELAMALGVSNQTVSRWENGKKAIGDTQDRLLRSLYMFMVAEKEPEYRGDAMLNLFKGLPHSRKEIVQSSEIELNPQEWMMNVSQEKECRHRC